MRDRHFGQGIYLAHRTALVAYATPILGSREAAEDIVQDAYFKFVDSSARMGTAEQTLGYLYRIVRNLAFDMLKRRRLQTREEKNGLPFWALGREEATPEQSAVLCDELEHAARALAELPVEMRIATEMHRFGGYTLEEVAEHLGISVATAHRHVRTAMIRVAERLDQNRS